jgi:hypothetical protein
MDISWGRILPVLVSIGIIILVAVLREYSKTFAAIAATMPINVPLALWIVAAGDDHNPQAMAQFTQAVFINIWPTMVFIVIVFLAARAGWRFVPMVAAGYAGWGISLGLILVVKQVLHVA